MKLVMRYESIKDATVTDLVDWCHQRGLDPGEVRLAGVTNLRYETKQSDAERQRQEDFEAERAAKTEEWERQTLRRLTEKYGEQG